MTGNPPRLKFKVLPQVWHDRPKTRGDCEDAPRPCPWVSCRHHLALDVNHHTREVIMNWPVVGEDENDVDFDAMTETCSLDVAKGGESYLEEVGDLLNVSYVRVMVQEQQATKSLHRKLRARGIEPHEAISVKPSHRAR